MDNICYMCGRAATTREHVPPICLFPEMKDTNGIDYRKNLITVPSCIEHNSKKSNDDEFLMTALSGIVGNNYAGFKHLHNKVFRSLIRRDYDYMSECVIRNSVEFTLKPKKGVNFPVLLGNVDYHRLEKCFIHIAYGLYFYEFHEVFKGSCRMLLGFVKYPEEDKNNLIKLVRELSLKDTKDCLRKGNNPEIFNYVFGPPDKFGIIPLVLKFYGGTEVFISLQKEGLPEPWDFGMMLINGGIETTINVGDKKFTFNKKDKNNLD